jgi:hypothetical protein
MNWSPASQDDLRTLIEMGLIEMHGEVPGLTNEGERVLELKAKGK